MYIGNTPTTQAFTFGTDSFDGNGVTLQFTLSRSVPNVYAITVIVNNVPQNPFTNSFSVNSNILTFTEAPSIGTKNVWVFYNSYITQLIQPGYKTVSANQIADNYALWDKINSDINYSAGNVGIGTSSPTYKLQVQGAGQTDAYVYNSTHNVGLRLIASGSQAYVQTQTNHPIWFATNNGAAALTVETNGNIKMNSGYGSAATAYGCRAWVNFNGTGTPSIQGSGNVSSITDVNVGNYVVNFATAMPDTGYCMTGSASAVATNNNNTFVETLESGAYSTAACQIATVNDAGATRDATRICTAFFR